MEQTLDQTRAAYLLARVKKQVKSQEYRRRVEQLPSMILTNGLGQTLAFLLSDSNDHAALAVATDLAEYLTAQRKLYRKDNEQLTSVDLLESIVGGDRDMLQRATDESLSLLTWWKKLVRAYIPKQKGA